MTVCEKSAPPQTTKNQDLVKFELKDLKDDLRAPKTVGLKTMTATTPKTADMSNYKAKWPHGNIKCSN